MSEDRFDEDYFVAMDCLAGKTALYNRKSGDFLKYLFEQSAGEEVPYTGRGMVDVQINGVNGVDFNSDSLSTDKLLSAAGYLLSNGVTTFFPTVITNSVSNTRTILSLINKACFENQLLEQCIGGIHLEGPFISPRNGFRGAHQKKYIRAPDWDLFCSFQDASGGRIKIISLSPEWENANDFIRKCRKAGLLVAIAHSGAGADQINSAVGAGAKLASHIGNAVPLMLPRHSETIYAQLANDGLYASIIADGFHLPVPFISVVIKTKKKRTILVSDATCFAGMVPGDYKAHIGENVILGEDGSLRMKSNPGLLAGSARLLTDNVQYLVANGLADISQAWYMASEGPARMTGLISLHDTEKDRVVFNFKNDKICIYEVFKRGVSVWKKNSEAC